MYPAFGCIWMGDLELYMTGDHILFHIQYPRHQHLSNPIETFLNITCGSVMWAIVSFIQLDSINIPLGIGFRSINIHFIQLDSWLDSINSGAHHFLWIHWSSLSPQGINPTASQRHSPSPSPGSGAKRSKHGRNCVGKHRAIDVVKPLKLGVNVV